jgi:dienelactone hydrolase
MKSMFFSCMVLAMPLALLAGEPTDKRLGKPKDYNGYFPWTPPASKEAWDVRRGELREQVLVANGLWPMPEKIPLKPVIHGKIERDGYTVEKVFFASLPGHYVSGNLYRPIGKTGKLPGILSPHGHWGNESTWGNGRLYQAGDFASQMKQGAEQTKEGAMYLLQARCAQLARLGCVVFHYDMVGYADSTAFVHRKGFTDAEAELRLQNFMGLQTFNSIRCLDFLLSLPDVDSSRIGVTGASGGGTQTFILCGVDERATAAFPAVMVGTAMQGGCVCENASYLRIGTGNVELAGLIAPRPLGMTGADDWTVNIESKGLPELRVLYKMVGADGNVMAEAHKEFKHNYNQVSSEIMYNFFNKHLKLGHSGTIKEQPFVPVPPKQLSVYDAEHPVPKDVNNADGVRRYLTTQSEKQIKALLPKDATSLAEYRRVLGTALRVMMNDKLHAYFPEIHQASVADALPKGRFPAPREIADIVPPIEEGRAGLKITRHILSRKDAGEAVHVQMIRAREDKKNDVPRKVVVWVDPAGLAGLWKEGELVPAAHKLIDQNFDILAVECLRTGKSAAVKRTPVNKTFAGYTFGYNRPLLAERVHDILTAVQFTKEAGAKEIYLVGEGSAGPWVVLARGLCGDAVARTAADMNQFRFEKILSIEDDMMLPGGIKYGGLMTLAGLIAPHELYLHNCDGTGSPRFLEAAYQASGGSKNLQRSDKKADADAVISWLLR